MNKTNLLVFDVNWAGVINICLDYMKFFHFSTGREFKPKSGHHHVPNNFFFFFLVLEVENRGILPLSYIPALFILKQGLARLLRVSLCC